MSIKIIAAIGKNSELGKNGDLCFHIKEDMQFFKEKTTGNSVLMGKRTWESIGRPLKDRKNFVVTHNPENLPNEVLNVENPEEFIKTFLDKEETLFIIGGASIYQLALPFAEEIYLTEIDAEDKNADVFFPNFDKKLYNRTILKKGSSDDLNFQFVRYQLKER